MGGGAALPGTCDARYMAAATMGSQNRWVYLIHEQEASVSCLRHGLNILLDYRFAANDAEPLLVLLATGVEKLLKLTYGLMKETETGVWPTRQQMGSGGWGHDVARLDANCRTLIRSGASRAACPHYIIGLVDKLNADPYVNAWLATLTRYATAGRFFNLDHLADAQQPAPSPRQLWDELLREVAGSDREPTPPIGSSLIDRDALVLRAIKRLTHTVWLWWETYNRAWVQGICGSQAKRLSGLMAPPPAIGASER
jgi:hypothetical protein